MGKYSVRGSALFDAKIDADMQRIADELYASGFAEHWKALVLLGGYGRGEGSPLIRRSGDENQPAGQPIIEEQPFNDYDLIVVTDSLSQPIRTELRSLESNLSRELRLPVDLYPYLDKSLSRCEFSLLNYEMRYGHRVIRGSENILDAMPAYPHNAVPLSEGTRLLLNRGKLLLDIKRRLKQGDPLSAEERIRFLKFLFKADLAFGDCALLLRREYDISYSVKKERIQEVDLTGLEDEGAVRKAYLRAIEFKEWTDFQALEAEDLAARFKQTLDRFIAFFLWHEQCRLQRPVRTAKEYAAAFPQLGREGSGLKNAARNLRVFRAGALPALAAHPRLRLYAALPLLLSGTSRSAAAALLNSPKDDFESLCAVFYTLQNRFS